MDNTREKLIEILRKPIFPHELVDPIEAVADYLLDNGVTFATDNNVGDKWISVTEQEEPTENGTYLCYGYWFGSRRKQTETADFFGEWNIANNFILTHWMPLPEPPKEEKQ